MKRTTYMGHVIVRRRRRTGVRSFSSAFPEYDVYYQSSLLNTFSTLEGAKEWIRGHGERKRKNPTKAQKRLNASKRSKQKRVAVALKKYLQQQNPGTKLAGAKVQKLKGGVIKITPIKANAGSMAKAWKRYVREGASPRVETKMKRHLSRVKRREESGGINYYAKGGRPAKRKRK